MQTECATDALDALAAEVRRDLATLAYPAVDWVQPAQRDGRHVYDVVIVGGGQSGLAVAFGLKRDGVTNVLIVDRNASGGEGVWESFGRMQTLRTPKFLVGLENGIPSLSVRSWFEAVYGRDRWAAIDRIPRTDWAAYLRWFRVMTEAPVRNDTAIEAIEPDGELLALTLAGPSGREILLTRKLVLATGYDGCGEWRVPRFVSESLPPSVYAHSNGTIDFERLRGKRIGVLGHGASAFDNALRCLETGVASVDHCFRRPQLPIVNPHRWIEFAGFLKHFPDLDDRTRWNVNRRFKEVDQPPARNSFERVQSFGNYQLHAASPWLAVRYDADEIRVTAPRRQFAFDFVITATGSVLDLAHRPELKPFVDDITRWCDRFDPAPEERHPGLGEFPYLDRWYGFQERRPGAAPWLRHVHAFNFSAIVSMGPHSTSISGHKYSVPRLVRGLTRDLMTAQTGWLMPALCAYDEPDLEIPAALAVAAD
ncbi:MAG: oxidoreductase [Rhodospirillales bacterium]|nr:oxidoreductase [Rhodospirillales bacterium]